MGLRSYMLQDYDAVIALWSECGLHLSRSDTPDGLARKLERDPDLFLLAVENGVVIGSIMGSYDGRRGWINKLAVAPARRGGRLGDALIAEVERRLKAKGCDKVNLLIEPDNGSVEGFYRRLGYCRDELIFMEKWLG